MADKVHLTKEGIKAYEWDGESRQYVDSPFKTAVHVLRCVCHIDEGVTLGDIFRAVAADELLAYTIGEWAWCDVAAYHEEAQKPTDKPTDLSHIAISKFFEWDELEADVSCHMSGIGKTAEHHYALDFTPVNELAHLPVRLNPTMNIFRDGMSFGEAPCTFTLLDVLGEIYFEISFHGSPANRDKAGEGLRDAVREIEEGTAKLVPFEFPEEKVN